MTFFEKKVRKPTKHLWTPPLVSELRDIRKHEEYAIFCTHFSCIKAWKITNFPKFWQYFHWNWVSIIAEYWSKLLKSILFSAQGWSFPLYNAGDLLFWPRKRGTNPSALEIHDTGTSAIESVVLAFPPYNAWDLSLRPRMHETRKAALECMIQTLPP